MPHVEQIKSLKKSNEELIESNRKFREEKTKKETELTEEIMSLRAKNQELSQNHNFALDKLREAGL